MLAICLTHWTWSFDRQRNFHANLIRWDFEKCQDARRDRNPAIERFRYDSKCNREFAAYPNCPISVFRWNSWADFPSDPKIWVVWKFSLCPVRSKCQWNFQRSTIAQCSARVGQYAVNSTIDECCIDANWYFSGAENAVPIHRFQHRMVIAGDYV